MDRVFADSNVTGLFYRAVFVDVGQLHFDVYVNREVGYGATKNMFFMNAVDFSISYGAVCCFTSENDCKSLPPKQIDKKIYRDVIFIVWGNSP